MKSFIRVLLCLSLTVSTYSHALSQYSPPDLNKESKMQSLSPNELVSIAFGYTSNFLGLLNAVCTSEINFKGSSISLGQFMHGSANLLDAATHVINFAGYSSDMSAKIENMTGLSTSNAYIRVLSNLVSMGMHVSNLVLVKRSGAWRALGLVDAFEICGHANDLGYSLYTSLKSDATEEACQQE